VNVEEEIARAAARAVRTTPEYARVIGSMATDDYPIYITPEFHDMIKDMDVYADALASGQLVVITEIPTK